MKRIFLLRHIGINLIILFVSACNSGGGSDPVIIPPLVCDGGSGVTVSWTANREAAVNTSGGGYIVYFSESSGFSPTDGRVCSQDVPYVSGPTAPTSAIINPPSGTWYVRVAAISELNAPGTTGGSESAASSETSVVVP